MQCDLPRNLRSNYPGGRRFKSCPATYDIARLKARYPQSPHAWVNDRALRRPLVFPQSRMRPKVPLGPAVIVSSESNFGALRPSDGVRIL